MKYDLILADPPWRYSFSRSKSRKIENQYPTLDTDILMGFLPPGTAAENSVLYLWATAPKLIDALDVLNAWCFNYKTHMVWDKMKIGMGYWARGQHELLLIGTRGKPEVPAASLRRSSLQAEKRSSHSAKPEWTYRMIEEQHPNTRKLEMFARQTRPGWDAWGNEVEAAA